MPLGAFKAALMGTAGATTEGDVVLLSTQTADGDSSVTFSSGITSTYSHYIFKGYNFNPGTNGVDGTFQFDAAGESGQDEVITSTSFRQYNQENDGGSAGAGAFSEQGNGTAKEIIFYQVGNAADENAVAELHLWNPASTTYTKHFQAHSNSHAVGANDLSYEILRGGYINTTAAITSVSFHISSGNFDGKFKMWGVK